MGTITIHTVQGLNEQGTCISKRCTIELIVLLLPAFVYMRARKLLVLFRRVHLPARRALCFCVASQLQLHPRGSSTLKARGSRHFSGEAQGAKKERALLARGTNQWGIIQVPPCPLSPASFHRRRNTLQVQLKSRTK